MRGTPVERRGTGCPPRIIPAYAGNTFAARWCPRVRRDHPRVCGEHLMSICPPSLGWGSSPRMRGTHHVARVGGVRPGIIPAYAGNTHIRCQSTPQPWDHPRVCGEHVSDWADLASALGSSPRMRGTLLLPLPLPNGRGIIPAYAGNTPVMMDAKRRLGDHPRVCGEHQLKTNILSTYPGSSPRMRGTQKAAASRLDSGGIIPAYAGNTGSLVTSFLWFRDHPRVCGEHYRILPHAHGRRGSSPRMRGTRGQFTFGVEVEGIIPAYAGNTRASHGRLRDNGDHPRVCGEHNDTKVTAEGLPGSSPRMRGTP